MSCPVHVFYAANLSREQLAGLGDCWNCGEPFAQHPMHSSSLVPPGQAYAMKEPEEQAPVDWGGWWL